jgi:hypothetical protein
MANAKPQVSHGVKRYSKPPMNGTVTNVSRIAPSTGIYGVKLTGPTPINAVKVRGSRVPKGRGPI